VIDGSVPKSEHNLDFTGERFIPGVTGEIEMEHYHRYHLACEIVGGKQVLDIACGEGYGSALMARHAQKVIGVDIDPGAVDHARDAYRSGNLEFHCGSCTAIPLPDASVDVVVSFETIEHHAQHHEMMREIVRVLRPDGVLMISSPDRVEYSEKPAFHNEFHVKELDRAELEELILQYFPTFELYGQRTTMASMIGRIKPISPVTSNQADAIRHYWSEEGGLLEDAQDAQMPRQPVYFIALASAGEIPRLPQSVFEVAGYVEARVRQVANDYQGEIARIGLERDQMLVDKDQAWGQRVEQVAADYGREIERISIERDQALLAKDRDWKAEVNKVSAEYQEILRSMEGVRDYAVQEEKAQRHLNEVSQARKAQLEKSLPLVSLVVVNYNGRRFLKPLLDSIEKLEYPRFEVVFVDNASVDDSVEYVGSAFPWVRIIESRRNLGFAGGNNLGMTHAKGELIGLINNDTVVDPLWLSALVEELMSHPAASAAGSKILFFRRYVELNIQSGTFRPSDAVGSGDTRELGVLVDDESCFIGSGYRKLIYSGGFWGPEYHGSRKVNWTNGDATLRIPLPPEQTDGSFRLKLVLSGSDMGEGSEFAVNAGGRRLASGRLEAGFKEFVFDCDASFLMGLAFDVINNAGTDLNDSGEAGDRGIYEVDTGQFDVAENVNALCGASMLMRRSALIEAGLFDSSFFMYYEDTDLCWRLRKAGGSLRYVPGSVVRHVHTGSSVEWSPTFIYYVSRNHVLIKIKHAPASVGAVAYATESVRCLRAFVAAVRRGFRNERCNAELRLRLRIQYGLLKLAPLALLHRWTGRLSATDMIGARAR